MTLLTDGVGMTKHSSQADQIIGGIRTRLAHDSAAKHVTGEAVYIDDMPEPRGTLHIHPVSGTPSHARITRLDLDAVRRAPGVRAVLTAADIPGENDWGHAGVGDDRVLSDSLVEYAGQIIFAVVADTVTVAREAAGLAVIEYADLPIILTVDDAMAAGATHIPPRTLKRGDAKSAIAGSPHGLSGRFSNGGQEHFYLETQISLAVPKEDGQVHLYCSTQDPSSVQSLVAKVLALPANAVAVEVRRLGGGFGGKETVATHYAAIAALAATVTGHPCKVRLDRDDDMRMTGKRHDFTSDYSVGYNDDGRITGLEVDLHARCGNSIDQSIEVLARAAFHIDNCYYLEHLRATCHHWKTNTVSAVAFRGFGTPQGFLLIESIIDRIARHLGLDPLAVRKTNFYGGDGRDTTPFNALIPHATLHRLVEEIELSSGFALRRQAIDAFNATSPILKKGLALTPIKYGCGFGVTFLNQGGALLHVYKDGSLHLNHGGTEMGQGLHIKVAQVVAEVLQVDVEHIRISATTTEKVPNTIGTAASSGTDLNAGAARNAALVIKQRLTDFLAEEFNVPVEQIVFRPNRVAVGNQEMSFPDLAGMAFMNRISLSAAGYFRAEKGIYDPVAMTGEPHRYYVFGAAVAEVILDTLTGENKVTRIDILHDVGKSLNEAIDYGQLEGGFIQGMGWLTTEEVVWNQEGRLLTHAPSTYKIPACGDRPDDFRMKFVDWTDNIEDSIYHSKAIGEPPFCLGISVFSALSDAIAAVSPRASAIDAPATPERILMALTKVAETARPARIAIK